MSDHSHWSCFDENLEMLELNRLQYMCRMSEHVSDGALERLGSLAQSAGYADADSFLSQQGLEGPDATQIEAIQREMFENYQDSEYWNAIDRSQIILSNAGGEGRNRELAAKVCNLMRDAYERGRTMRIENERAASPPSP